ncbi:MAG TPA: hypothetical protein VGR88_05845, partial [Ktedonobacterales bacterium]|nr:hypothetical protein [Ktedonobacterales bacterium]
AGVLMATVATARWRTLVRSFLINFHQSVAPIILVLGGIFLLAGLGLIFVTRRGEESLAQVGWLRSTFRVFMWLTAAGGVLQAILGALLLSQGLHPKEGLHFVYGLIVLAAVPVAFVYSDQKKVRADIIIMTIAAAAIVGAAVRAMMTGV